MNTINVKTSRTQKCISFKEVESIRFNMDSMRTKLLNEQYENPDRFDEYQVKIDEIETLMSRLNGGRLKVSELERVREIVNERKFQRYVTCLNAGLSEQIAGGAFND